LHMTGGLDDAIRRLRGYNGDSEPPSNEAVERAEEAEYKRMQSKEVTRKRADGLHCGPYLVSLSPRHLL